MLLLLFAADESDAFFKPISGGTMRETEQNIFKIKAENMDVVEKFHYFMN